MAILDKNAIIERIKALSKEQGYSLNYMYKQLLLPSGYLRDVNANKTALTEERISAIASFLKTTPEYLKGETDIKEKAAPVSGSDLPNDIKEITSYFVKLNIEEKQELISFARYLIQKHEEPKE